MNTKLIFIIFEEVFHGKRYDKGQSATGHSAVYAAADYRKYFPAALQHGRHDHRRPVCRGGCAGGGWFYGNNHVSGARICTGYYRRIYGSDIAAVRREGYERCEAECGKRYFIGSDLHGVPDIHQYGSDASAAPFNEHTGKYFRRCLYLYHDHLRRSG